MLDCFTSSALLDWALTPGAVNYTATARSTSGHVSICHSNYTNCELLDLQCGQRYEVMAVASNKLCSSRPSTSLQVESGTEKLFNVISSDWISRFISAFWSKFMNSFW